MLDESTNNRIQNGDLGDYQYASSLKITPGQGSTEPSNLKSDGWRTVPWSLLDFDPILNQLAAEANLDSNSEISEKYLTKIDITPTILKLTGN